MDRKSTKVATTVGGALGLAAAQEATGQEGSGGNAQQVGVVAGALLGKILSRKTVYKVEIKMDDGVAKVVELAQRPSVRIGERVVVRYEQEDVRLDPQVP